VVNLDRLDVVRLSGISIILFLCVGITALQAQTTLNVKSKDGTQTAYPLSGIQKLTFPTHSVVVTETNGTMQSYTLSNVRYLSFANLTVTNNSLLDTLDSNGIKLYPSPASEELNINYRATNSGTVQIRIINLQGQIVLSQTHENAQGENNVKLNISELSAGLYLVSNGKESRSFIKYIK